MMPTRRLPLLPLPLLSLLSLSACEPAHRGAAAPEHTPPTAPALDPLAGPPAQIAELGADPVGTIPELAPELAPAPAPAAPMAAPDLPLSGPVASAPVEVSPAGAWELRRAGGGSAGMDLDMGVAESVGSGGLGVGGSGMGGGGLGGLGTRGYGAPSGAPKAAAARPAPAPSRADDWGGAEGGYPGAPAQQQPGLRAGMTDDNANFDAYLQFVGRWQGAAGPAGPLDRLEVSGQRRVLVEDGLGRPLPGARVDVVRQDTGETVWTAFTTGDGVAPYYPDLVVPGWGRPAPGSPERAPLQVVVSAQGQAARARWAPGEEALRMRLAVEPQVEAAVPVDVCFIIDTTGSMGDEIARVQQTLLSLTQRLRGSQAVDLRYGAVLYRDVGDQYLTMAHPMTGDLLGFDRAIQEIQAGGGGDGPESLNQGLAVAVSDMDWRPGAAKVAFLIADAPPHMDYQEPVTYGRAAAGAAHKGVRVHTVAASGLDDAGSAVFRQIAQMTRGRFIFIEYGSTAASAADHGVTGQVASNNLDQILYDRIRAEVDGWRGGRAVAAR
ncbi:MAG: VWA domain-containing protein [Deltaproteobacteria bacterium]|jgi:Mg-chelatase subunit ChlD|nr:VWA domain-containing protein [Deltaproteobacteria bacterium]